MKLRDVAVILLAGSLWVGGCSGDAAGGERDGIPDGSVAGTLVASGVGAVRTLDLSGDGGWQERFEIAGPYAVAAVHLPGHELYVAELDAQNPMFVNVYDLDGFGRDRSFVWPDTEDLWRVEGLAVAPDGRHVAAQLEGIGEASLQVLDMETEAVVADLPMETVEGALAWTEDLELVFATVGPEEDVQEYAAIVAVPLGSLTEADGGLETPVLQGFNQAEWGGVGVEEIAISQDGSQIAYVLDGDIWVTGRDPDAEPRQLTTGPTGLTGPAFSPDGSQIVFVGKRYDTPFDTLVLPNDDSGPHHVDIHNPDDSPALVLDTENLARRVLVWLP